MGYFGLENMLLRHLMSGAQGASIGRGYDNPVVNDMGLGFASNAQKKAAANKYVSKSERRIMKSMKQSQKLKKIKKGKKPKKVKSMPAQAGGAMAAATAQGQAGGIASPLRDKQDVGIS